MDGTIDLSNDAADDGGQEVIELMDDEEDVEMEEVIDVEAEQKRKRRRRLKLLLHSSVTPSFIAIISPNYEEHLPKRFKV